MNGGRVESSCSVKWPRTPFFAHAARCDCIRSVVRRGWSPKELPQKYIEGLPSSSLSEATNEHVELASVQRWDISQGDESVLLLRSLFVGMMNSFLKSLIWSSLSNRTASSRPSSLAGPLADMFVPITECDVKSDVRPLMCSTVTAIGLQIYLCM